ncbi:hypothetical protein [Arthrobacter sp. H-02-3]|nr:hypothetical protein [Arthrobacter sp. H-02-3]
MLPVARTVQTAGNSYRDTDKVSANLTTWRLNGKSFAQAWGVAPRKR